MAQVASRLLIVDDNPIDRETFQRFFKRDSATPFDISEADSGEEALELCATNAFDCILVDYLLPDFSGLELMTALKKMPHFPPTPFIMLTGQGNESVAVAAMKAGASDYLIKGQIDQQSLRRTVRACIDRTRLKHAERALSKAEMEMEAAQQIQQRLFPKDAPQIPGFDIAGQCQTAVMTGGDYFDYFPMPDGRWAIVVADVSSHGFGPALIMASTRRLLRTLATIHSDVSETLALSNTAIYEDTEPAQFVTMFFAAIDPQTRSLTYAGAGHQAFIISPDGSTESLPATSLPLGVDREQTINCGAPRTLDPGQILLLTTDGVDEARDDNEMLFGTERVLDIVAETKDRSAAEIVAALFDAVHQYCAPNDPHDDVTVVVVKLAPHRES